MSIISQSICEFKSDLTIIFNILWTWVSETTSQFALLNFCHKHMAKLIKCVFYYFSFKVMCIPTPLLFAFGQISELVYLSMVKNSSPISKYFERANGWGISKLVITTDKETDDSWDIFIIWKINSGLVWAAKPVLWKKFGANYEQLLKPFFMFSWAKNRFFENIVASALKSWIE